MKIETVVLLFNGCAFMLDVVYHLIRLHYEKRKIKELEKQTRMMEFERNFERYP